MLKIFAKSYENNPITEPIKEFIGAHFLGTEWRRFSYPILKPRTSLSSDEAIARNILAGELEKESLAVGRFDVHSFLIKNTDALRFRAEKNTDALRFRAEHD